MNWIEASTALGMFLLGMWVMTRGLEALVGSTRSRLLARFTRSPWSGAALGATATAVIQSSSVTTIAAVGFVSAGMLSFSQALGILFGANLGTTLTGWMVTVFGFKFAFGTVAGPVLLAGVLLAILGGRRASAAGSALAGFALVFVGVGLLQSAMAGLAAVVTPDSFPAPTLSGRLLLVGIGLVLTVLTQSSSAGVATALTALNAGAIDFVQAASLVIGMDIGTTFSALLAASVGGVQARRTGLAHVVYNLLTGLFAFFLLDGYLWAAERLSPGILAAQPEFCLVGFHSLFNGLGVLAVLPLTGPFARLIVALVPTPESSLTAALEPALLRGAPSVGLVAARGTLDQVFVHLLQALRSEPLSSRDSSRVHAALAECRNFLAQLPIAHDHPQLVLDRRSLERATDHLDSLLVLMASPGASSTRDPELERARAELDALIAGCIADGPRNEHAAKESWSTLEAAEDAFRTSLTGGAAPPRQVPATAFPKLDEMRRLRQLAYQLWRTLHHLEHFDGLASAPATART